MAAVVASGVGGCARVREGEKAEEGRGTGESEGPGRPGVALALSRRDEGEPGRLGERRWLRRVRACVGHALVFLAEEEDDREEAVVGWAVQLQCWAGWWRQVRPR